jgi:hypothetical protein
MISLILVGRLVARPPPHRLVSHPWQPRTDEVLGLFPVLSAAEFCLFTKVIFQSLFLGIIQIKVKKGWSINPKHNFTDRLD